MLVFEGFEQSTERLYCGEYAERLVRRLAHGAGVVFRQDQQALHRFVSSFRRGLAKPSGSGAAKTWLLSSHVAQRRLEVWCERGNHFAGDPGSTSLSTPRTLRPLSSLAASTIPCDSIPMSFRGFRLATITTRRPTKSSGA